jgi:predicted nucleotidyltransferase
VPFLRSDAQARILAELLLDPEREATITELGVVAGIAQPNAGREVDRLVQAGLLRERRVGRARLVSADPTSPYLEPLAQILARSYGPVRVIGDALAGVPGVVSAVIFGSYAARYQGEPGGQPRDVDVLVVGEPPGRDLRRADARIEEQLGVPVQIAVVTESAWAESGSGFLREVRSRPTIPLDLTPGDPR